MRLRSKGFTLVEVALGIVVLAIALSAILGAYVGQVTLNEHARNLSLAIQDANRVIERMRQQTAQCVSPNVSYPTDGVGCTGGAAVSWDDWLQRCGGQKSIQPDPTNNERIIVTCQDQQGATLHPTCTGTNPIRVTVAACWRHRGRVIGECSGTPLASDEAVLVPNDDAAVIQSPAMLTTLVTCRG